MAILDSSRRSTTEPPIPWLPDVFPGDHYVTREIEMTEAEIIAFASQYDPQVGHTDPIRAKETYFQGLSSSGWFTACLTSRLVTEEGMPFHGNKVGAGMNITWPTSARPGDRIHVEFDVKTARLSKSRDGWGIIEAEYETVNQNGEVRQRITTTAFSFEKWV